MTYGPDGGVIQGYLEERFDLSKRDPKPVELLSSTPYTESLKKSGIDKRDGSGYICDQTSPGRNPS